MMTRLIVLNRYFFPDHSATSQLLSDLMFHLASIGVDGHVITSRQLYDDPQRQLPAHETIGGISIHRISTTKFGRSGLAGRAVDYLSFYHSANRVMRKLLRPGDILVAMTDPPLSSILGMWAARRKRAHLINWLQDIYPEIAVELGVPFLKGPVAFTIGYWRDRSLKSAALNVVVGQTMADKLTERGIAPNRIKVIHNWADDNEIVPVSLADNRLRQLWGLDGKFVVGYSGNLGRAHEFDTILAASEALRNIAISYFCSSAADIASMSLQGWSNRAASSPASAFFPIRIAPFSGSHSAFPIYIGSHSNPRSRA